MSALGEIKHCVLIKPAVSVFAGAAIKMSGNEMLKPGTETNVASYLVSH